MKIKEGKLNETRGGRIALIIAFAVFAAYSASVIFAFVWAFYNSLKTNGEFFTSMMALPEKWLFSNYIMAFKKIAYNDYTFLGMLFNSLWFAGGSAVLGVLMHCVTGYVFAKYKFFAKETAFAVIVFTITLPILGSLPSFYRFVVGMNIKDSPLFLITSLGGFGANFLITYAFFKSISWSYAEAAFIDGAGHFYVFFRIMLPLAVGPIFALSLLGFIGQWNNYETPMLFLDRMPPLASGLYRFSVNMKYASFESPQTVYFAGVLITAVPSVAFVSVFGGKIMNNVSIGGIKG